MFPHHILCFNKIIANFNASWIQTFQGSFSNPYLHSFLRSTYFCYSFRSSLQVETLDPSMPILMYSAVIMLPSYSSVVFTFIPNYLTRSFHLWHLTFFCLQNLQFTWNHHPGFFLSLEHVITNCWMTLTLIFPFHLLWACSNLLFKHQPVKGLVIKSVGKDGNCFCLAHWPLAYKDLGQLSDLFTYLALASPKNINLLLFLNK